MIFRFCLFFLIHLSLLTATEIKAVAFDFGGVIGNDDHALIDHFIATSLDVPDSEVEKILAKRNSYIGEGGTEADFFSEFVKEKGTQLPLDWYKQYQEVSEKAMKIDPKMVEIVKALHKMGYTTAMLSNVTAAHAEILREMGIYEFFRPLLLSYKMGVEKPNPVAFQMLLHALALSPEQVIFVDNEERNVAAAKKLGIDAILFTTADNLLEELKKRHIVVNQ